jgi:hypothetical protein
MPSFVNITGHRFGRLVAQRIAYKGDKGHYYWLCKCDCGGERIARISYLRNGAITSCGKCFHLTYEGKTQPIYKWSLEKGICCATITSRLDAGMTLEEALDSTVNHTPSRKNPEEERRKVLLAIENISSTLTARREGRGARAKEIEEYTKISQVGVRSALKWLKHKNLVHSLGETGWLVKSLPPKDNFCFKHGVTETINNVCIKCFNERKKK